MAAWKLEAPVLDRRRNVPPKPALNTTQAPAGRLADQPQRVFQTGIRPLYFADKQLFGVYYSPAGSQAGLPVLICSPIGHEYVRSYNAIRKLCERLARNNIAVLKFDYHGMGDSAGDGSEVDVEQWRNDIRSAVHELTRLSGQTEITLVGLRLGATLAAGVRTSGVTVQNLVMWDPVVDGSEFLAELCELHRLCLVDTRRFQKQQSERMSDTERLGFRFPVRLQESIASLRLLNKPYPYQNCFLLTSSVRVEYQHLQQTLDRNTKGRFTHQAVLEPLGWDDHGRIEAALIANGGVAALCDKIMSDFV